MIRIVVASLAGLVSGIGLALFLGAPTWVSAAIGGGMTVMVLNFRRKN